MCCISLTGLTRPSSADGFRQGTLVTHIPYRNSLLTMVLRDSLGELSFVTLGILYRFRNIFFLLNMDLSTAICENLIHSWYFASILWIKTRRDI